jgi:hypothetical protein
MYTIFWWRKRAKELDKLDPNLIESMNVFENALDKYGEDGANGVIDITRRK